MIYFDSVASYPMLPEVREDLRKGMQDHYANPSSSHMLGEQGKELVENTREIIAESLGAFPSEIIFTSGATETNNLILKGVILPILLEGKKPHLIISKLEHKCILLISNYLEHLGCEVTYLQPNSEGQITPRQLESSLKENTALVSIMHVNNELGTINPISEFGKVCTEAGIPLHTDAAQSYLKIPTDVDDLNVDFMSISAHKIGGPKGIGAAYIRDLRDLDFSPLVHGAGQEFGIRGGTVPTPLVAAFGTTVVAFPNYYKLRRNTELKERLLIELESRGIKYKVNGGLDTLPSCTSLTLMNSDIEALFRTNHQTLALSQGSACSARSIEPSHVLTSLNLDRDQASKTLRVSFSHLNTIDDIQFLANEIAKCRES